MCRKVLERPDDLDVWESAPARRAPRAVPAAGAGGGGGGSGGGGGGGGAAGRRAPYSSSASGGFDAVGDRTVFIRGTFGVTRDEIVAALRPLGDVAHINDKHLDRGFGHVHFATQEQCARALAAARVAVPTRMAPSGELRPAKTLQICPYSSPAQAQAQAQGQGQAQSFGGGSTWRTY